MNRSLVSLLLAAGLLFSGSARAQSGYEMVEPPLPTDADGKVEVIEFFWYGCPHCYQFHPHVDAWSKSKPDNVVFRLVAPPLNPSWAIHSRAYYAAEVLDVVDKWHGAFFDEIHQNRKAMRTDQEVAAFAASLGIDPQAFKDAMYSFAVETNLRRSMQLANAYRITGVPTVAINGKYKTSARHAGGYPQMIRIMQGLIEQESR